MMQSIRLLHNGAKAYLKSHLNFYTTSISRDIFEFCTPKKHKASKISCGTSKRLWPHCALYRIMIQAIFYYIRTYQHIGSANRIFSCFFGNQDQLKGGLQKKRRGFSRSTSNNLSTFTKLRIFNISSVLYLGRLCCFLIQ